MSDDTTPVSTVVKTDKGIVVVTPGTRSRIVRVERGKAETDEERIYIAEWKGNRASGSTIQEAVERVQRNG